MTEKRRHLLNSASRRNWLKASGKCGVKLTEPILFGMHLCKGTDTLYLFEGEFDAMCGYQSSGNDCVSVPSGCEDYTWLDTCYEWLGRYEKIAVFADNDSAGHKMLEELSKKIDNVYQPDFDLYNNCKDCNDISRHGQAVP